MNNMILISASVVNIITSILYLFMTVYKTKRVKSRNSQSVKMKAMTKEEMLLLKVLLENENNGTGKAATTRKIHKRITEKTISDTLNSLIRKGYVEVDYSSDTNGAVYKPTKSVEYII